MTARLCAIFVTLLCGAAVAADVGLYLYPRAERGDRALAIADIANIEADAVTKAGVGSIVIDDALYADGYLDRSEIIGIIEEHAGGSIAVYGSGVRVVRAAADPETAGGRRHVVKSGSPVRFQVVCSGVRVEQMGTAMQDGAAGDVIPVRLKGSAVGRGVILDERTVELKL
ncbi:MAG: flagella basal body P-ring formation protein FlgA [Spirochaetes bacterium]|nr:flagella basal body P-ring formation protein FlgA [Spirochaetota bacterium]